MSIYARRAKANTVVKTIAEVYKKGWIVYTLDYRYSVRLQLELAKYGLVWLGLSWVNTRMLGDAKAYVQFKMPEVYEHFVKWDVETMGRPHTIEDFKSVAKRILSDYSAHIVEEAAEEFWRERVGRRA